MWRYHTCNQASIHHPAFLMERRQQYHNTATNNMCVEGLETKLISYRQHSTFCRQVNSLLVVKVILEVHINRR